MIDHKLPAACIGMYWGTSVMIRGEGNGRRSISYGMEAIGMSNDTLIQLLVLMVTIIGLVQNR
uniref:Uncharacterized protein n=1 Tax=Paenibacillus polymyxa TaxID=1406 RepID=A0AAE9PS52_PAEPO